MTTAKLNQKLISLEWLFICSNIKLYNPLSSFLLSIIIFVNISFILSLRSIYKIVIQSIKITDVSINTSSTTVFNKALYFNILNTIYCGFYLISSLFQQPLFIKRHDNIIQ